MLKVIDIIQNVCYYIATKGNLGKEFKVKSVLLYFADKGFEFLLAMLGVVVGYYITKWLDGRNNP